MKKHELENQVKSLSDQLTKHSRSSKSSDTRSKNKLAELDDQLETAKFQSAAENKTLNAQLDKMSSDLKAEKKRTKAFIADKIDQMSHTELVEFINERMDKSRKGRVKRRKPYRFDAFILENRKTFYR